MITLRCDSCSVMYESDELDDSPCAECGSDRIYEVTRAERLQEIDRAEIARLAADDEWYSKQKREFVAVDHLTPAERAERNRELDAAMEHIQAVYAPVELPVINMRVRQAS